jgi:hypothetical protein
MANTKRSFKKRKENTFYIIFLDKNHQFWITEKKHT